MKRSILIVDNSPYIQRLLRQVIEDNFDDIMILSCLSLDLAMNTIRRMKENRRLPHLVISELNLQGNEGGAVISNLIKAADPEIPVIVISEGLDSDEKNIRGRCGADEYISKPFEDLTELASIIKVCLEIGARGKIAHRAVA